MLTTISAIRILLSHRLRLLTNKIAIASWKEKLIFLLLIFFFSGWLLFQGIFFTSRYVSSNSTLNLSMIITYIIWIYGLLMYVIIALTVPKFLFSQEDDELLHTMSIPPIALVFDKLIQNLLYNSWLLLAAFFLFLSPFFEIGKHLRFFGLVMPALILLYIALTSLSWLITLIPRRGWRFKGEKIIIPIVIYISSFFIILIITRIASLSAESIHYPKVILWLLVLVFVIIISILAINKLAKHYYLWIWSRQNTKNIPRNIEQKRRSRNVYLIENWLKPLASPVRGMIIKDLRYIYSNYSNKLGFVGSMFIILFFMHLCDRNIINVIKTL